MVFNESTTQGHVCFVYSDMQERMEVLADYFKQGIANNELCVFVTNQTPGQALRSFKAVKFDATKAISHGYLRIFEMDATYLPNGQFVKDFMMSNVLSFIDDAKVKGFNGLRTAGEMAWISEHPEAADEATAYEAEVNTLDQPNFVGLCLYPAQKTVARVLQGAKETHPTLISHGHILPSPSYQTI